MKKLIRFMIGFLLTAFTLARAGHAGTYAGGALEESHSVRMIEGRRSCQ
jgi:hypothetical protein